MNRCCTRRVAPNLPALIVSEHWLVQIDLQCNKCQSAIAIKPFMIIVGGLGQQRGS